ncbi:MAG: hypothetical protein ABL982_21980, partial [Vicinamibacterales bacterium]
MTDPALPAHAGLTLEAWIAHHGPVQESAALVTALDLCAQASRMSNRQLAAAANSLTLAHLVKGNGGRWIWVPASEDTDGVAFSDADIVERIGTALFHALSGQALHYPLASEPALRAELRRLRPGLPTAVANLTIDALTARRTRQSLSAFAGDIRQTLGIERYRPRSRWSRTVSRVVAVGAAVAAVLAIAAGRLPTRETDAVGVGLTGQETLALAIGREAAETFAFMDEHTAAIQVYLQLGQVWAAHVPRQDPRAMWNDVHHSWVRTLAGDRLTPEQLLEHLPAQLDASLGKGHPYTRTVRLALAATVEARGATADAHALRQEAAEGMADLFRRFDSALPEVDPNPTPPGVVAHVAPNAPELEGFAATSDGAFEVSLTGTEQMIASRNGWRLHLRTTGSCRVSLVTGTPPQPLTVEVTHTSDQAPRVQILGTAPMITLEGSRRPVTSVLLASANGQLDAHVDGASTRLQLDPSSAPPVPPYGIRFTNIGALDACALVW